MQAVLGLDFGGSKIAVAVCDLDGRRLAGSTVPTSATAGAQINLRFAIDAAQALFAGLESVELVAVGASTFGIPGDDGVRLAPAIPGWENLRLAEELGLTWPGAAIRVITDVKAAAFAEYQDGALVGCDPGLYVNLGTGLAVAIVANGAVVAGHNGAAGEIGYNLRALADVGKHLGDRVMLEEAVSGMGLARSAGFPGGRPATAADVFASAEGDAGSAALVEEFVAELAFHLVNLTIAINPVRIVVGGGLVASWDQLHDGLRAALDAAVPYPPELLLARHPFDAPLRGALLLARSAVGPSAGPSAGLFTGLSTEPSTEPEAVPAGLAIGT